MLQEFLDHKPLYYSEIDYARMPRVYEKIKSHFGLPKTVHLIGTNGKGTTGRFLASALHSLGQKTGHYTSPHILKFNERIWLNGENVSDELLDAAHKKLQTILTKEDAQSLSYFEYTTFLAMLIFKECDYVVLEAGLGGEHDATAVFPKELTLVTPIDYDHESFLGNSIKEIARTKLNAVQKSAVFAKQNYKEIEAVAKDIAAKKGAKVYNVDELLDAEDLEKVEQVSQSLSLVNYLRENLKLSIAALKLLGFKYSAREFKNSRLFGRLSRIRENVLLDVGHNPLAAASIVNALKPKKYILVYNTYKDKNYKEILRILKPIVKHVEIIDIYDQRIEEKQILKNILTELEIKYNSFKGTDKNSEYLVFGSFSVAQEFLSKDINE